MPGAIHAALVLLNISVKLNTAIRALQTAGMVVCITDGQELARAKGLLARSARFEARLVATLTHGAVLLTRKR